MARKTKQPPRILYLTESATIALQRARQEMEAEKPFDAAFAVLEAVEFLGYIAEEAAGMLAIKLVNEWQE